MEVTVPAISYQSRVNPKVKITLEFGEQSEDDLKNILKHLLIEKMKLTELKSNG